MSNEVVNVLLVDDTPGNLDALEAILNFPDCRLVRAASGQEALRKLLENEFAVIVLDMMMPDLGGLELAKLIKQRPRTEHVPIIFLTAHMIEEHDILLGYGAGAVDYLSKPISPGVLRSKISVFVDLFRKTRALTTANLALEREVVERKRVQLKLQGANQELESRVQERTSELTRLNGILHKNAERMRLAITGAGMATWDADPATGNAVWSSTMFRMLGYPTIASGEATVDQWRSRLHPEDRERVLAAIEQARATGELYSTEHRIIRADDSRVVWILPFGRFLPDASGPGTRFVGVCFDDSVRKASEEALKDADRRKDEFLAMLSHELRNPLWPIANALAILQTPAADEAARREALSVIERQVRNVTKLIEDLLDVSRITSGKVMLKPGKIDVASVVENAIENSHSQLESKKHKVSFDLSPAGLCMVADPTRLEQVLSNLITNAAKYTDPGGKITVTVRQEGAFVVFRVRDNGVGIPSEKLSTIFDLFHQIHATLDRSSGGLGVGLTLVRKLVELHGGTVTATSEGNGMGSEFSVRLPIGGSVAEVEPAPSAPAPRQILFTSPLRILIVEDAEDSRALVKMLLELNGHEVAVAGDENEALDQLQEFEPQVALVDIGLPGMNGYDLGRRIRKQLGSDVLMIAMTGYGDPASKERSREAGFDHHLVKPIDPSGLTSLLLQAH